MKKKVYCLSTCSTCKEILRQTKILTKGFELQDIKNDKLDSKELEEMKKLAGSDEALFSRRAIKYREWRLQTHHLSEKDYRHYLLNEYTFLKRPVVILNNRIFVGSEKKTIAALIEALSGKSV